MVRGSRKSGSSWLADQGVPERAVEFVVVVAALSVVAPYFAGQEIFGWSIPMLTCSRSWHLVLIFISPAVLASLVLPMFPIDRSLARWVCAMALLLAVGVPIVGALTRGTRLPNACTAAEGSPQSLSTTIVGGWNVGTDWGAPQFGKFVAPALSWPEVANSELEISYVRLAARVKTLVSANGCGLDWEVMIGGTTLQTEPEMNEVASRGVGFGGLLQGRGAPLQIRVVQHYVATDTGKEKSVWWRLGLEGSTSLEGDPSLLLTQKANTIETPVRIRTGERGIVAQVAGWTGFSPSCWLEIQSIEVKIGLANGLRR